MLLSQAEIGLIEHVQNIKELKHTILSYPNLFNTNHKDCRRCDLHDVLIITNATPTNIKFIRIDICSKFKYINFYAYLYGGLCSFWYNGSCLLFV